MVVGERFNMFLNCAIDTRVKVKSESMNNPATFVNIYDSLYRLQEAAQWQILLACNCQWYFLLLQHGALTVLPEGW